MKKFILFFIVSSIFLLSGMDFIAHATPITPVTGGGTQTSTIPLNGYLLIGNPSGTYSFIASSSLTGSITGNIVFLANGSAFVTTSTINFQAGTNVTITTSTNGTYTIAASGGGGGGSSTNITSASSPYLIFSTLSNGNQTATLASVLSLANNSSIGGIDFSAATGTGITGVLHSLAITQFTGVMPIANGGTNATSAAAALANLGGITTSTFVFAAGNKLSVSSSGFTITYSLTTSSISQFTNDVGYVTSTSAGSGNVNGIGTTNFFPYWTGAHALSATSSLYFDGASTTIIGPFQNINAWGTGNSVGDLNSGSADQAILFWDPNKASFFAGENDSGFPSSSIGSTAAIFGYDNEATGYASFATGERNQANGESSFATGENSQANGFASFAGGGNDDYVSSTAANSMAFGSIAHVTGGSGAIALGIEAHANGDSAGVFTGDANAALANYSTIVGGLTNTINSSANDNYTVILGGSSNSIDSGSFSTIIGGSNNYINVPNSLNNGDIAIGSFLQPNSNSAIVIGNGVSGSSRAIDNTTGSTMIFSSSTIPSIVVFPSSLSTVAGNVSIGTTTQKGTLYINGTTTAPCFSNDGVTCITSGGGVTTSSAGTPNFIPIWTSASAVGNSSLSQSAGTTFINGTTPIFDGGGDFIGPNIFLSGSSIIAQNVTGTAALGNATFGGGVVPINTTTTLSGNQMCTGGFFDVINTTSSITLAVASTSAFATSNCSSTIYASDWSPQYLRNDSTNTVFTAVTGVNESQIFSPGTPTSLAPGQEYFVVGQFENSSTLPGATTAGTKFVVKYTLYTSSTISNALVSANSSGGYTGYAGSSCAAGSLVTSVSATGTVSCVTTSSILASYSTSTAANPTANIGTATVNGSANTFMRSDAAPTINQAAAFAFSALGNTTSTATVSAAALQASTTLLISGTSTFKGNVSSTELNQILYATSTGVWSGLSLGTNLSISGSTLNAAGGSGSISTSTQVTIGFYPFWSTSSGLTGTSSIEALGGGENTSTAILFNLSVGTSTTSTATLFVNGSTTITGSTNLNATTTIGLGTVNQFSVNPSTNKTYVEAGSSTIASTVGGTITFSATSTGNSAGASTSIEIFAIPTSTYLTVGDEIDFYTGGTFAPTAATNKQIQVSIASTTIFDTGASFAPANIACNWFLEARGMATKAIPNTATATTTILWTSQFTNSCQNALTDDSGDAGNKTVTATTTAPININIYGNGTNTSDTVANYFRILYNPF